MERPDPSTIPLSPGVYIYKNPDGKILYIGKARILRRRVLSYFRPTGLAPKTVAMLARATSIEYIATTTEKEALLLEASLIKKHRPPYNIVLRDDKHYVLFKVNLKHEYPRLEFTRRVKRDGAKYFGPFTSALAARETWKLLHRAFSLRRCPDRAMKNRVRPCLYYHMGQCPAPCRGLADKNEYRKTIFKVCDVLGGRADAILTSMRAEMETASGELDFERAAVLRDQVRAIERTVEKQAAIIPGAGDMDAVGVYQAERGLALSVVFVRGGAMGDSRSFYWPGLTLEDAPEVFLSFLGQFYSQASPPPRIILPWIPGDTDEFAESLRAQEEIFGERRGGSVRVLAPQNEADNRLVDLAQANAREESLRKYNKDIKSILERVGAVLKLKAPPARVECVDVSHISGKQTRVGMVVYEEGRPKKEDYRVYAMPDSADDYGTLYKWVEKRLESGEPWPDLLLIDGGKGQLASVAKAFKDAGKENRCSLAAIAKARDEYGHADRRAGNVADRIFVPGRANPLPLKEGSQELLFLQQIRDATHQFAVQGHRKARRSAAFSGELMRLPGVGPATARLLWDKFGNLETMRKVTEADLRKIPGIGAAKAKALVEKLRNIGL